MKKKISGDSTKNSEIPLFFSIKIFAIFIRLQLLSSAARELAKTTGILGMARGSVNGQHSPRIKLLAEA